MMFIVPEVFLVYHDDTSWLANNSLKTKLMFPTNYYLFLSLWRRANARNVRLLSVLAVHRPFYVSICISTLPTQNTTFIPIITLFFSIKIFNSSLIRPQRSSTAAFTPETWFSCFFKSCMNKAYYLQKQFISVLLK